MEAIQEVPAGRTSDKFVLRLPEGMRTTIKVLAARNRRTMNSEILYLIDTAMKGSENAEHQ